MTSLLVYGFVIGRMHISQVYDWFSGSGKPLECHASGVQKKITQGGEDEEIFSHMISRMF